MEILSKQGVITPDDDKTNITIAFNVPAGTKKLSVEYSYFPKEVADKAAANNAIAKAMKKYDVSFANPEAFLPVKNLVTLSFDECGKYRGACHRQAQKQSIIIAEDNSTPGIVNRPLEPGEWDVVLNVHYAGCDINYSITINEEVE